MNQLGYLQCAECNPNELLDVVQEPPLHCSDEITKYVANCGFTLGGGMYMDTPGEPLQCARFVHRFHCPVCSEGFTRSDSLRGINELLYVVK
jgi:hypothetical protein